MDHVTGIEPVITQFIHHDFVGRKIEKLIGELLLEHFTCKQKAGLAELVAMRSVLPVPHRADSINNLEVIVELKQFRQERSTTLDSGL